MKWIIKTVAPLFSPPVAYRASRVCLPYFAILTLLLAGWGLWQGLFVAPPDYQQGEGFRLIYLHVPSATLSLLIYLSMMVAALLFLVFRLKMAWFYIQASTGIGALFTAMALITGAIWGKPMWGTFWVWDARLTSELLLLVIYGSILLLHQQLRAQAQRLICVWVLIGGMDLPIIHYSVKWWNTLHQGETVHLFGNSLIAPSMARPLWVMILAAFFYFCMLMCWRLQTQLLYHFKGGLK